LFPVRDHFRALKAWSGGPRRTPLPTFGEADVMSWSKKFLEPIVLPNGNKLATLLEAGTYIMCSPKQAHVTLPWQNAMHVFVVGTGYGGPVDLPRVAMMKALFLKGALIYHSVHRTQSAQQRQIGEGLMNTPDVDTALRALEDARRILGQYIDPGPQDPEGTLERWLAVLDREDLVKAFDRINRRRVIRRSWNRNGASFRRRPRHQPRNSRLVDVCIHYDIDAINP
jgi:hypothetical protein